MTSQIRGRLGSNLRAHLSFQNLAPLSPPPPTPLKHISRVRIRVSLEYSISAARVGVSFYPSPFGNPSTQTAMAVNENQKFNYEALIRKVKLYPAVFDSKHEMHKNRAYVNELWRQISEGLKCTGKFLDLRPRTVFLFDGKSQKFDF